MGAAAPRRRLRQFAPLWSNDERSLAELLSVSLRPDEPDSIRSESSDTGGEGGSEASSSSDAVDPCERIASSASASSSSLPSISADGSEEEDEDDSELELNLGHDFFRAQFFSVDWLQACKAVRSLPLQPCFPRSGGPLPMPPEFLSCGSVDSLLLG